MIISATAPRRSLPLARHRADEFLAFLKKIDRETLKPVVERYQGKVSRIYFRADAGFANPDVYEFLEAERIKYAIRLPANRILQERISHLLTRPIGRPPNEVRAPMRTSPIKPGVGQNPA